VAGVPRDNARPLVVSLIGRFRVQDGLITPLPRFELVVDEVLGVWPEETCEKAGVHTTLDNTYWKLVELNGKPVTVHEDQREMHLILRTQNNQLGGFGGCNALTGRYEVDGDRLRFVGVVSTEAACSYLADEEAFVTALARVTNYQSVGESLQLRDDTGPIARLRAVYFR
jgi:heat shock protein HslJ